MSVKETNRKIRAMLMVMIVSAILVSANIVYTMTTHHHLWSGQDVLNSQIRSSIVNTSVEASRGNIYDRNGNIIAQEIPAYTIVAYLDDSLVDENGDPDYVSDPKKTARELKKLLPDIDEKQVAKILKKAIRNEQMQTELGTGTKRLDKSVMEEIRKANIPGIGFVEATKREYPSSPFASNLIGFAAYDEDEQKIAGKLGLEESLDDYLSGEDGRIQYQQMVDGSLLPGTLNVYKEAVDGDDVILTIDSNLQSIVETQLQATIAQNNAQSAWAIVVECETGKILAWGSYPTFDQNHPTEIPTYQNALSQMNLEPGSVMKPFVYATAIDTGVYPAGQSYTAGSFTYTQNGAGKIIRVANGTDTGYPVINDALGENFGVITFEQGLAFSSNIAICELLANYVNYDQFSSYLDKFGFYQYVDIPFVPEQQGVKNIQSASDYLSTGFGQASSLTILQLVQAYTAIFNDGKMMKPYVVDEIVNPHTNQVVEKYEPEVAGEPISAETAAKVRELMKGVMADGATGARFSIDGVDMIAKTGTGEIYNEETHKYDSTIYTSSVMAAAPADDPKIMVYWGMQSANIIGYSEEPFKTIMQAALIANAVNGTSQPSQPEEGDTWATYEMPSLVNHSLDYAMNKMSDKNVKIITIGDGNTVIDQFARKGQTIYSYDRVFLLTNGNTITMPDMTGWTRKDITAFWQLTGIGIQTSGYGKVSAQNIEPGTPIDTNTDIQVTLE
ncbi:penicillin-binding protein [Erysipelotrichaceae bacterium 66-17]